jgi:hypothetical protein
LLSLVVPDVIWAELPNYTTIINGEATTIDRISFPPPAQPADNASPGQWKYNDARDPASSYTSNSAKCCLALSIVVKRLE